MNRKLIKDIVPPILLNLVKSQFYGWSGNYPNWDSAVKKSDGYDKHIIIDKVLKATRSVIAGEGVYERDGIIFHDHLYNFALLSTLAHFKEENNKNASVIDFGGSLGSLYWQHRSFLLPELISSWNIVEQEHFVKAGKSEFETEKLKFYYTIDECLAASKIDILVLSSVLQYIPDPFALVDKIIDYRFPYLFIDRTAFKEGNEDRLTIQKTDPAIYKATYPCWFLSLQKFIGKLSGQYELMFEFDALDQSNLKNTAFKGMLFKAKK